MTLEEGQQIENVWGVKKISQNLGGWAYKKEILKIIYETLGVGMKCHFSNLNNMSSRGNCQFLKPTGN